jgi:hypothetical protein
MVEALKKGRSAGRADRPPATAPWNFGTPENPQDLDEFLGHFQHFEGNEQWLRGIKQVGWENFFLVCTKEFSDLSYRARRMVIEYCLQILESCAAKVKGQCNQQKIQDLLQSEFVEEYDNPIFQFKWALRDKVISTAVLTAFRNRYPT